MKAPAVLSFLSLVLGARACLTEYELQHGGHSPPRQRGLHRRQGPIAGNQTNQAWISAGVGDRFANGAVPRGLGILDPPYEIPGGRVIGGPQPDPALAPFQTVYNTIELSSGSRALAREFGLTYFEMPYKTFENRTMFGLKVPGSDSRGKSGYTVLLEAGIHARERGGPDHMLNFIADLLWARREKRGLTYGASVFTAEDVRTALSVGIVVVPLVNPDGVAYDHATDSCWRKNRNPASAMPNETSSVGVDLNRNFPAAWDFKKALGPNVTVSASDEPSSEAFVGTAPLSEPESKNIDWTMGQMPDMRWFLDLHSMAGVLLYGWGHDSNQATDKAMNLLNENYDGQRGAFPDKEGARYGEYYIQKAYDKVAVAVINLVNAMAAVAGYPWVALQSVSLYPATGVASSHPMYRAITDKKNKWAEGLTLEFGSSSPVQCVFYPTVLMHQKNMAEVGSGLMSLLLSAARLK